MSINKNSLMRYFVIVINVRNDKYLKQFGLHLRNIRKAKGISQGKLSTIADLPLSQIGKIERGEINTTLSTVLALAKGLMITPSILLDFPFDYAA